MCDQCRASAESMVRSANRGAADEPMLAKGLWRPPSRVEGKPNWKLTTLKSAGAYIHQSNVTPQLVKSSGGIDPAFSSEICYPSESDEGHEHWFDRMVFAVSVGSMKKNLGDAFGIGDDEKAPKTIYQYVFNAPIGTLVRCQYGEAGAKEVAFPELVPIAWITEVWDLGKKLVKNKGQVVRAAVVNPFA